MKVWVCLVETIFDGEGECTIEKVVASEAAFEAWRLEPPRLNPRTPNLERCRKIVTTPYEVEGMS